MRKIWAYVAGLGTAFIVIFVLEAAVHFIFPMPLMPLDPQPFNVMLEH